MTRAWTPRQWWNAPESERFYAYYLLLRQVYRMPAVEALREARRFFALVPGGDLIGSLRDALAAGRQHEEGR